MFINPGSGGLGIGSVDGYKLQSGSPCINTGFFLPNNGGQDYWGTPISSANSVDRGAFVFWQSSSGVDQEQGSASRDFQLDQNYPNPFNPDTNIRYQLASKQYVELSVYDILGRIVRRLKNGVETAGIHTAQWDGNDDAGGRVSSGVYLARLVAGSSVSITKMILSR
jgi:hypothetical protein